MIPKINKILYATDLSKNSDHVFLYAAEVARRHNAKIVILHAVEPIPPYIAYFAREDSAKVEGKEQQETLGQIEKVLVEFCERTETQIGLPCVTLVSGIIVRIGHAIDEILKTAEEEGCDVIVLGTHGKGFLKQTFIGSTARSVLNRTRKPILMVPLPDGESTSTGMESGI